MMLRYVFLFIVTRTASFISPRLYVHDEILMHFGTNSRVSTCISQKMRFNKSEDERKLLTSPGLLMG